MKKKVMLIIGTMLVSVIGFAQVGAINLVSFSAKIDFATGFYPSVAVGDIDGDGKPDMVTANAKSNTISVFRNTSNGDNISFAARVDFIEGQSPNSLTVVDIDGDGKSDVIVANAGYTISVFRNTSNGDNISFAARVDYATQDNPLEFVVGDIDGDGKPDIVVANYSTDFISVFRNTSNGGNISFALRMDVALGARPHGIAIGDIDGDGKLDVLVSSYGMFPYRNYISVLRNTGKNGAISFAAEVELASSTQDFPTGVAIGDIDGDGKPDIVVGNYYGYISPLRNTSPFGTISFASELDFSVAGVSYVVVVVDIDGDGKPDVITADFNGNMISVLENTSDSGNISFATKVDFVAGQAPNSIAISDINGDGRLDVVVANTGSNTVSIFRNQIVITSIKENDQVENGGIIFTLYPNPAKEALNLEEISAIRDIEILDMRGQRVLYQNNSGANKIILDISNLPTGLYILRALDNSGKIISRKIIKS